MLFLEATAYFLKAVNSFIYLFFHLHSNIKPISFQCPHNSSFPHTLSLSSSSFFFFYIHIFKERKENT